MNTKFIRPTTRAVRTGVAVAAVALLIAAGAWHERAGAIQGSAGHLSQPAPVVPALNPTAAAVRDSYADVARVVAPTVVTVRTEGRVQISPTSLPDGDLLPRFFGEGPGDYSNRAPMFRQHGLGSGVVVAPDGYVLTNHHVVEGADHVRVDLIDGRSLPANVIGSDPPSDLALLKIDATDLHPIVIGDSDAVQVGDVVLAVGNPLGVGQTVTMGIVSAKGRSTGLGDGSYEDFLQTDAPINQGNSGGALVNTRGELVGINSQIVSPSGGNIGIGFAIPANMARHVMTVLGTDGRVRRGQLGVTVQPVTSDLAAALGLKQVGGAVVSSVEPGSAAARAGVRRGDVIESFDGHPVPDANTLRNRVAGSNPGARVPLVVVRDGHEQRLTAQLDEVRSQNTREATGPTDDGGKTAFGVSVTPLAPERASQMGLPSDVRGLLVGDVNADSRAADAGLQPGDVIQEVNRQPVLTVEQLRTAVKRPSHGPMLLLVSRSGRALFLTAAAS
jgi:serine protease Do